MCDFEPCGDPTCPYAGLRPPLVRFPGVHGDLGAPNVEQLLEPDPELGLAGGPLHDPCAGGPECEAMCVCDGGE